MNRGRPKKKLTGEALKEHRRAYQRKWYRAHTEQAKEYQRVYNQLHRKTLMYNPRGKRAGFSMPRDPKIMAVNASDIMHSPTEKTIKLLTGVISGEIIFSI